MNNTEDIAMTVKEALELYFQKSKEFWMRAEKTYPRTAYIKDYDVDNGFYVSGIADKDEYVQWRPVLITEKSDFDSIEKQSGYKIHESIKELLSVYFYADLECLVTGRNMIMNGNYPCPGSVSENIKNRIIRGFNNSLNAEQKTDIFFEIGCTDSDGIFVNNITGEVIVSAVYEPVTFKLSDSVEHFICLLAGI